MSALRDKLAREYRTACNKLKILQKYDRDNYRRGIINTPETIDLKTKMYDLILEKRRLLKIIYRIS